MARHDPHSAPVDRLLAKTTTSSSIPRLQAMRTGLGEAKAMKKDAVCGMTIAEKGAVGTAEYRGIRYYFCSEACRAKFDASPAEFVK